MTSKDRSIGPATARNLRGYLKAIRLKNIRGFQNFSWSSCDDQPSSLLIIGENGTGKSTLLRCLTLLMLERPLANQLLSTPYCQLVREGCQQGQIEADFIIDGELVKFGAEIRRLSTSNDFEEFVRHPSDALDSSQNKRLVRTYSYGVSRSGISEGESKFRDPSQRAVRTLFSYDQPLVSADIFLRYPDPELLAKFEDSFRQAIGYEGELHFSIDVQNRCWVELGGDKVLLESWADGYRLTFSWLMDMWHSAISLGDLPKDGPARFPQGLLLIDEIEQHAHPTLQVRMVERLKRALPWQSLILTTHSPLVAIGVPPAEVLILKRGVSGIEAGQSPDFSRYSLDEMVNDDQLFSTHSQSPEVEGNLREWNALIAIPKHKRAQVQQTRLKELSEWFAHK